MKFIITSENELQTVYSFSFDINSDYEPKPIKKFKHNKIMISSENKLCIGIKILGWKVKETIGVGVINVGAIKRLKKVKHIDVEEDILNGSQNDNQLKK